MLRAMNQEEIELSIYFKVLWKWRRLIVGVALFSMLLAWPVSLLMPKIYETSLFLEVGQVWEKPLDDTYRVAEVINSESFLDKIREKTHFTMTANEMKSHKIITAKTLEGSKKAVTAIPSLVEIAVKADTPEKTIALAQAAADLLIQEHKIRFDALMKEYGNYETNLEEQSRTVQKEIEELDSLLKRQRTNPQVNAPAVILLQAQLEQKQSQWLGYVRELRDVRISNRSNTRSENTRVIYPPILPIDYVSPKIVINVVITGLAGVTILILFVFFMETIKKTKENLNKH
jgi:uncharacterized protein involved in exopolysaccharide biosynthesis